MSQRKGASRVPGHPPRHGSSVGGSSTRQEAEKSTRKGASLKRTGFGDRWQSYLAHHKISALDSLQRLLQTPLQSFTTALVMAIALALPAIFLVGLGNIQALGDRWDSGPRVTVFLHVKAREAAIANLHSQLRENTLITAVEYVSAEQALREFERESGMGSALRTLDTNPLPAAFIITPKPMISLLELDNMVVDIKQSALVEDVLYDQAWIKRLYQLLEIGERLIIGLGTLLILGVLLVIGNTIRLAIENRRDEIVVIKLVGGTDAFVRRPFLYTGLWYGLGGGVIACLLLVLGLWALSGPVAGLAGLYQSDFELTGLGFSNTLILLLLAAIIGWLGAFITVARQLNDINPE